MDCPSDPSTCDHVDHALRESELRFRSTFENAAVGMGHVAPDGTWLRVNRRLSEIVGYTPEELLERTFQDITHPEDLDTDRTLLEEFRLGERDNCRIDKRYFRKDGSIVWVNLTVGCVRSPAGEVEYLISVIQDITERKQVHEALVQSEAKFRAFQQTSPEGFMIFSSVRDENGNIVDFRCDFANPAAAAFAQMEIDQMLGHRMLEETPVNRDVGLFDIYCKVVETGETAQEQVQIRLRDGRLAWFRFAATRVGDGFAVVFADISKRKKAEADLNESEARFRAVQQTSPDGFLICRAVRGKTGGIEDFICVFANPAAHKISAWQGETLVGQSMKESTPPQNRVGMFELYKRVVETGETIQDEIRFPLVPDNRWIRYSVVKVEDGFAISFSDISDRKAAELALIKSEARFRAVQQTSPDGFIMCRSIRDESGAIRDFVIDYVNTAIERYLGRPASEIVGGMMRRQMPVNFTTGAYERYVEVVETGESWQGELTFPRRDGKGDGWYRVTVARVGDGVAISYGDITDAKVNEALLQARDKRLHTILSNVVAFIGLLSPEGILLEANETALAAANLIRSDVIGKPFWETYWWSHNSDTQQDLRDSIARAARGERVRQDMVIRTAGDNRAIIDIQLAPIFDDYGNVVEIVPSGIDISDRKKAEKHREMLVRELSHRVKNSLATVQTIASHTLREATDLDSFREAFVGRLMAISKCHDLLIDTTRRDAHLAELVRDQVLPYARAGAQCQVTMSGPNLVLGAEAAHTFGLILHELATNAAKYGALSTEEGRLEISWNRGADPTLDEAVLKWKERGGPPVSPPTRRGFGSVLIEQSLTYSLGGQAEINYLPEGLQARFRFPKRDRI